MINLNLESVKEDKPTGTDRDLADLLNVWVPPVNYKAPYPQFQPVINGGEFKPNILIEGGSFSEQFINTMLEGKVFNKLDLYFYYKTLISYPEGESSGSVLGEIGQVDWDKDVLNRDVIIIEMNEQNIPKIQSGFMFDLLSHLVPTGVSFKINENYVEKTTINDKEGFFVKKGANAKGTSYFDSNSLNLEPNQEYVLSYTAKGYHRISADLFPDDLPEAVNTDVTDEYKDFSFTFKSSSENMHNAVLRFFVDGEAGFTDKDTYIYNIQLTKK
jgi:hypothetical protein